ncbi:biotin/lipoyl-containing protein, partial [Pseudomonadota bacterium]
MSKTIEIKVPDIGDFSGIPVIEVLVAEGDRVAAEDGLVTLESDKATMEVPSPAAGIIRELRMKLDDHVSEGDVVAVLELSDDDAAPEPAPSENASSPPQAPAEESVPERQAESEAASAEEEASGASGERQAETADNAPPSTARAQGFEAVDPAKVPYASPGVRQFARELGVDLSRVSGHGTKGRITREDVSSFVKSVMSGAVATGTPATGGFQLDFPPLPDFDFSRYGKIEKKALSRIQKISAGHLHRNWVGIPHVTQHDEADITDMEAFRIANADDAVAQGFKLTPLVFLIKAMVAALKKYPTFNASLDT